MTIRPIKQEDSRRIWEIRNHPIVRKYSSNSEIIAFKDHKPWFEKKYFKGQDNHCFVLLSVENIVIGYCRFDFKNENNQYIISIGVDPDFQGKGLGHNLLSSALSQFKSSKQISAEVQKNNIASVKLFRKNGFIEQKQDEKSLYMILGQSTLSNQKTVFISISRGLLVRNILRTGVLGKLLNQKNYKVVIIVSNPVHEYFKKEFNHKNIIIEKVEQKNYSKLRKFLTILFNNLIYTETEHKKIKFGKAGGHPDPVIIFWTKHAAFSLLSRIKFLTHIARWSESFFFKDKDHDYLFNKYKPDLLFCTSLYSNVDLVLLKAAKRFNVTSVSMPKSWDTVGRTFFRVIGNRMILNNSFMKDWVIKEQLVKKEDIYISGLPQFDIYANKGKYLSHEEFCQKTGLDKDKPIILYASEGLGVHWDEDYVDDLIKNHNILEKYNLILRPHFTVIGQKWGHSFKKYKNIYVDDESIRITNMFTDKWDPTIENMDWLAEVLHSSGVVITFATTLALDAFVNSKLVINIFYDLPESKNKSRDLPVVDIKELYDCFHYNAVLDEKPTAMAQSGDDVMRWIKKYLKNPEILSKERKRTINKICYKTDGNSAKRIADILIGLLNDEK